VQKGAIPHKSGQLVALIANSLLFLTFVGFKMKTKSLQRIILLATGICAVVVILLSQSFYQVPSQLSKTKSKEKKEVTIQAPSDVAAQGQAVELNHQQPSLLERIILSDKKKETVVFIQKTTINFFKTLFRVIISPNAP
jgi:hypothetical protein